MQPTFSSSRILLPVRPWFIFFTLSVALLLNFLPTSSWIGVPDWVALVLCFWAVREFRRIGMGWAFLFGIVMDVADGTIFGQHALAYVLMAYGASNLARRVLWFPLTQQGLHVFPLLLLVQVIEALAGLFAGGEFPGWGFFLGPALAALLWTPLTFILLLPQFQPVERDHNRPI